MFFFWNITFLEFVKDYKYSFSSKTVVFGRAMPKWLVQWEYSEKMLFRTGYNISVRPILTMFMTCGNLPRIKKSVFHKKLTIFEELCQNGCYSENIQKKCYLERGITFLYDRFWPCLWPFPVLKKNIALRF